MRFSRVSDCSQASVNVLSLVFNVFPILSDNVKSPVIRQAKFYMNLLSGKRIMFCAGVLKTRNSDKARCRMILNLRANIS